jgi:hypothetical protein
VGQFLEAYKCIYVTKENVYFYPFDLDPKEMISGMNADYFTSPSFYGPQKENI